MMWLVVTVARMASSSMTLRKSKTATPLQIWEITGGNTSYFFCAFLPIDKSGRTLLYLARISICQVISTFFCENAADPNIRSYSRMQRAGAGGLGPNFRSVYPICKIFATSSDLSYAFISPEKWPRRADRESAYSLSYKVKWPVG